MNLGFGENNDDKDSSSAEGGLKSLLLNLSKWDDCQKSIIARLLFVIFIMSFFFLSVSYKILYTALISDGELNLFSVDSSYRKEIIDRNGILLAINLPASSLYANPKKIIDAKEAAENIASLFKDLDKEKLYKDFTSNKSFVWIKRDLTSKEKDEVNNLGLPGIYFEEQEKRVYTHGNMFSHLIGYVSRDNEGQAGIEKSYDEYLKDTKSNVPLKLSLDSRLQSIVNEELDKTMETYRAEGAAAIIVNPNNGEVLACISKPDFNPHFPGKASEAELFNSYATGVYELGSINKIINMAIGFDTKKVAMNDAYETSTMRVAGWNIKDFHQNKGWHSVPEIFLRSSNVGTTQMMWEVGKEDFKSYITKLGLLSKLDIEIPEKGKPLIVDEKKWTDLTLATLSYGYAMSITPLHFVNAMVPVINGGTSYPIHFVEKKERLIGEKVLDEQTSKDMRKLLHLAATKGTAKKSYVKGYYVGGKTGTANKIINGKYADNEARLSSMLNVFPAHDPQYIIFIMLDNPKPTKETFGFATAGWTVAPMMKNIITRLVNNK
jgi:cell division protein FtsI (penicillin-binding protein 3)